jgi:hypothetical protein
MPKLTAIPPPIRSGNRVRRNVTTLLRRLATRPGFVTSSFRPRAEPDWSSAARAGEVAANVRRTSGVIFAGSVRIIKFWMVFGSESKVRAKVSEDVSKSYVRM